MKKILDKIVVIGITIVMLFSIVGFGGCDRWKNFSNEEHIERITERLQARYFYEDGTPRESATFRVPIQPDEDEQDNSSQGSLDITWQYITLERFEVQLIRALDGTKRYFMIQRFPTKIGFDMGIILSNNQYRIFGIIFGINFFDLRGVCIDNRYYAIQPPPELGLFAMRNERGELMTIGGGLLSQESIDFALDYRETLRTIRRKGWRPIYL